MPFRLSISSSSIHTLYRPKAQSGEDKLRGSQPTLDLEVQSLENQIKNVRFSYEFRRSQFGPLYVWKWDKVCSLHPSLWNIWYTPWLFFLRDLEKGEFDLAFCFSRVFSFFLSPGLAAWSSVMIGSQLVYLLDDSLSACIRVHFVGIQVSCSACSSGWLIVGDLFPVSKSSRTSLYITGPLPHLEETKQLIPSYLSTCWPWIWWKVW